MTPNKEKALAALLTQPTQEKAAAEAAASDPFIQEIEALIAERAAAKKAKDFARADEIRALLLEKGVTLLDTSQGTKYTIA